VNFNPFPGVVAPTCVISAVISSSSTNVDVLITTPVAAVTLVFSVESMLNKVLSMVVPFFLTSTIKVDPVGASLTDALNPVKVMPYGILKVMTPLATARLSSSLLQATIRYSFLASAMVAYTVLKYVVSAVFMFAQVHFLSVLEASVS